MFGENGRVLHIYGDYRKGTWELDSGRSLVSGLGVCVYLRGLMELLAWEVEDAVVSLVLNNPWSPAYSQKDRICSRILLGI